MEVDLEPVFKCAASNIQHSLKSSKDDTAWIYQQSKTTKDPTAF